MTPKAIPICFLYLVCFTLACQKSANKAESSPKSAEQDTLQPSISRIAFGSCGHEDEAQPILSLAAQKDPDLFLFLGDNMYGDTYQMDTLRAKYKKLGEIPDFVRLKATCPLLATWDDHDYGWNDSGRHYPKKQESKNIFLDFWEIPKSDERHQRPGIYQSYEYPVQGRVLQIIFLDMRTFRDDLRAYSGEAIDKEAFFYNPDYFPHPEDSDSTLLGNAQWQWLEEELQKPADLRLIASSTQFGITWNGYEAWANFPGEQKKMLDLIRQTQAEGVLFLSGDVHYAELSKLEAEGLYPIYDFTSSGITSTWEFATPNDHRVAGPIMENHFGWLEIDWAEADPRILMEVWDVENQVRVHQEIRLSDLQFPQK